MADPVGGRLPLRLQGHGHRHHRALTGVDGSLIVANLRRLLTGGARVILRCPLVPGANATPAHEAALAALATEFPTLPIERLPYHRWGEAKYEDLAALVQLTRVHLLPRE